MLEQFNRNAVRKYNFKRREQKINITNICFAYLQLHEIILVHLSELSQGIQGMQHHLL